MLETRAYQQLLGQKGSEMKFVSQSIVACFVLPVLLASNASAQTLEDLAKSVTELKESVAAITASVETLAGDMSELKAPSKTDDPPQPDGLRQNFKDLSDLVNENSAKQQEIMDSISVLSSSDKYVPRISANMSDPDFAKDFRDAVSKTYPETATLLVTNKTDQKEELVVNGKQYSVMSGASRTFEVPIGYSTLRLEGEKPMRWYVGAPTFKDHIAIETEEETKSATEKPVVSPVVPSSTSTIIYEWSGPTGVSVWYPATTATATPWRVVP